MQPLKALPLGRTETNKPELSQLQAALFVLLLFCSYIILFLGPTQFFAYWSFLHAAPDPASIAVSCVVLLGSSIILPKRTNATSLFLWLIFILITIPRFAYCSCMGKSLLYPSLCLASILLVSILVSAYETKKSPQRSASYLNITFSKGALLCAAGCILLSGIILYLTKGFPSLSALSFDGVYEIRAENDFGNSLSALFTLSGLYISPILVCFLASRSHYLVAALITGFSILFFLWTGNKTWAFIVLAAWILFFASKWNLLTLRNVLAATASLFLAQGIFYLFVDYGQGGVVDTMYTLFTRRFIFVPAGLGYEYWEFFQSNPTILLKGTALGLLTPFPPEYQEMNYPNQIAFQAMGTYEAYANTGAYGGEFANFSPLGGTLATTINLLVMCYILFKCEAKSENCSFVPQWACLLAALLLNATTIKLLFSPTGLCVQLLVIGLALYSSCPSASNPTEPSAIHPETSL